MSALLGRVCSLLAPPLCWGCGAAARAGAPLCGPCFAGLRRLPAEPVVLAGVPTWAPLAYEGAAAALARALKYRGVTGLAGPMAAQIVANAAPEVLAERAAIVPVPLHRARRRRRGYNQAALLGEALGQRTGLEVVDCLRRAGPSARQVGRSREQRIAGIAGTVAPRRGARRAPPHVVLVDDVATTGATLGACAAALRSAGARSVSAVVFARTPGR
jgi:ComF family protein